MDRLEFERLVRAGLTQRAIAEELDCSQSTVRYWLRRWGLQTVSTSRAAEARAARSSGVTELRRDCATHGETRFVLDRDGTFRCAKCRADRVAARRRRVKEILVAEAGGRCIACGFDLHPAALQFHHLDPGAKGFALGAGGLTRGLARLRAEARKCVLLCSNCHALVEIGFLDLPPDVAVARG